MRKDEKNTVRKANVSIDVAKKQIHNLLLVKSASEHREVLNKVFKYMFLEENLTQEFKCDIYTTIDSLEQFLVKLDAKS